MSRYHLVTSHDAPGGFSEFTDDTDEAAVVHATRYLYGGDRIIYLAEKISETEHRVIPAGAIRHHAGECVVHLCGMCLHGVHPPTATPEQSAGRRAAHARQADR